MLLYRPPAGEAALGRRRDGPSLRRAEAEDLRRGGIRLRRGDAALYLRYGPGMRLLFCGGGRISAAQEGGRHIGSRRSLRRAGWQLAGGGPGPVEVPACPMRSGDPDPGALHQGLYAPAEPVHGGPQRPAHRRLRRDRRRRPLYPGVRPAAEGPLRGHSAGVTPYSTSSPPGPGRRRRQAPPVHSRP